MREKFTDLADFTLTPNSIRLAKFCKDFAMRIRLLAAVSEGVSVGKIERQKMRLNVIQVHTQTCTLY